MAYLNLKQFIKLYILGIFLNFVSSDKIIFKTMGEIQEYALNNCPENICPDVYLQDEPDKPPKLVRIKVKETYVDSEENSNESKYVRNSKEEGASDVEDIHVRRIITHENGYGGGRKRVLIHSNSNGGSSNGLDGNNELTGYIVQNSRSDNNGFGVSNGAGSSNGASSSNGAGSSNGASSSNGAGSNNGLILIPQSGADGFKINGMIQTTTTTHGGGTGSIFGGLLGGLLAPVNYVRQLAKRTNNAIDTVNDVNLRRLQSLSNGYRDFARNAETKAYQASGGAYLGPLIAGANKVGAALDHTNGLVVNAVHGGLKTASGVVGGGLQAIKPYVKDQTMSKKYKRQKSAPKLIQIQ